MLMPTKSQRRQAPLSVQRSCSVVVNVDDFFERRLARLDREIALLTRVLDEASRYTSDALPACAPVSSYSEARIGAVTRLFNLVGHYQAMWAMSLCPNGASGYLVTCDVGPRCLDCSGVLMSS